MKRALSIWSLALGLLLVVCTFAHLLFGVPSSKRADLWNDWTERLAADEWYKEAVIAGGGGWSVWSPGYKHVVFTGMVLASAGLAGLAIGHRRKDSSPSSL